MHRFANKQRRQIIDVREYLRGSIDAPAVLIGWDDQQDVLLARRDGEPSFV